MQDTQARWYAVVTFGQQPITGGPWRTEKGAVDAAYRSLDRYGRRASMIRVYGYATAAEARTAAVTDEQVLSSYEV